MAEVDPSTETWRAIPGHEGRYEVSDWGRVRSLRVRNRQSDRARPTPKILKFTSSAATIY
jgi:hypothetical protein